MKIIQKIPKIEFRPGQDKKYRLLCIFAALALSLMISMNSANAETVAASQFGYHPLSGKQAVAYTNISSANFDVRDSATNAVIFSGILQKPKDFNGNNVNCQGNMPCLVADFSSLQAPGTYYVQSSLGGKSKNFEIKNNVYSANVPTFLEFYNALMQQGSSYHADMHKSHVPIFNAMADGSFIMEADQAAFSLIRLGSAYRKNPSIFSANNYDVLAAGKPDIQEYIVAYVRYLEGLQGVSVGERTDGTGFRLNTGMKIKNAFVPGPTSMTSLDVYIPGSPPKFLENVPVVSLCGANNGSIAWDNCMSDAAKYYKCQAGEPCLNIEYIEKTGTISSYSNGLGVSKGWSYEFGCFFDVNINEELFSNKQNPCMVFYPQASRLYTTYSLLGYLEALPAVYNFSQAEAQLLFNRASDTYSYIKNNYGAFTASDTDTAFFATALFLLYDYTGNANYLTEAYSYRTLVSTVFVSDAIRGNEFYWEEYIRHKNDIIAAGLQYQYTLVNPEEFFRGKMFGDYKDIGPNSISNFGERVFQFDNNIPFQNSRYILVEGLLAAKTAELYPSPEPFIPNIADMQLAWLAGMNNVQQGTALNASTKPMSFIFGIGDFPSQFHSRYLIDTGYKTASNGAVIGARGTNYQYFEPAINNYISLDGKFSILGYSFGSLGNGYNGETKTPPFMVGKTFKNGKNYIPGWINGPFDTASDSDVIFNYKDDLNTYEYTESTNEIVATALELISYLDARQNNKQAYPKLTFIKTGANYTLYVNSSGSAPQNIPNPPNPANSTTPPGCHNSVKAIPATCENGAITEDTFGGCRTIACSSPTQSLKILACDKPDNLPQYFEMYKQLQVGSSIRICINGVCIREGGYAKSQFYPICTSNTTTNTTPITPPSPTNTTTPSNTTSPPPQNNSGSSQCYSNVNLIPSNCSGGTITTDSSSGCRTIICSSGSNSMKIMACNKPDSGNAQYFEMYKQSQIGVFTICIGPACLKDNGYVKSPNYPICINSQSQNTTINNPPPQNSTPTPPPTPPPTTNTSTPPSGSQPSLNLYIAPWYPKGKSYVFVCNATNYIPTAYDWIFGDGHKQLNSANKDVYYTYSAAGSYTVQCNGRNSNTNLQASLGVNVI